MATYIVNSDMLELRRGSRFTTLPVPVKRCDLCLFDIGGVFLAGRYYPEVEGNDWIVIPGHLIRITGKIRVRCLGPVLPVKMSIKQITELPAAELERIIADEIPRHRR